MTDLTVSKESPEAHGDALAETQTLANLDNSKNSKQCPALQCERKARRQILEIKRESIWNIGHLADAHMQLMLGSLEIADDESVFHHCRCVVDRVRAVVKLVNDLRETREARS
jgi:hypothetical protein